MHQTTVRFGPDLWADLMRAADEAGTSVAQFVREAALTRLAYEAGRRDEARAKAVLDEALGSGVALSDQQPPAGDASPLGAARTAVVADAAEAREQARGEFLDSEALWAQGAQARRRAQELREQSRLSRTDRAPLLGNKK